MADNRFVDFICLLNPLPPRNEGTRHNFSLFVRLGRSSPFSNGGDGFISTVTFHTGLRASADLVIMTSHLLNLGSPFSDADKQYVGAWSGFVLCHAVVERVCSEFPWVSIQETS